MGEGGDKQLLVGEGGGQTAVSGGGGGGQTAVSEVDVPKAEKWEKKGLCA